MKIQNNENVSFKGIVKFTKQADAENPVIRPLVNYLKHHCGGKSVEHELYMNKMNVRVHSKYIPKRKLNGFDRHDNLVVVGGNQGHVEIVNELLVKLKNICVTNLVKVCSGLQVFYLILLLTLIKFPLQELPLVR